MKRLAAKEPEKGGAMQKLIQAAIKAQREVAEAKITDKRSPNSASGPLAAKAKGGRGRDKVMC